MAKTGLVHLAVRQRRSDDSILLPERAAWLWAALQGLFPTALAACLMRDHFHVLIAADRLAIRRLAAVLGNYSHHFGFGPGHWAPIEAPVPIRHRTMLALTIRYIVLNACRDRRCREPLQWLWSTYRDVMGAVAQPWVDAERLAGALGESVSGFRERHHAFVSRDPHVSVAGTPLPRIAPPRRVPSVPLDRIAAAAATAYRESADAIQRPGRIRATFVALALHQGWRDRRPLMDATDASRATVGRLLRTGIDPVVLDAARRCLGDARLCAPER